MSTSIHLHVEVRIANQWHHYQQGGFDWDAVIMARLGGVKLPDVEPIPAFPLAPDDISVVTRAALAYAGRDAFHHGCIGIEQIKDLACWLGRYWRRHGREAVDGHRLYNYIGFLFGNHYENFEHNKDRQPEIQAVRFIYWFT